MRPPAEEAGLKIGATVVRKSDRRPGVVIDSDGYNIRVRLEGEGKAPWYTFDEFRAL